MRRNTLHLSAEGEAIAPYRTACSLLETWRGGDEGLHCDQTRGLPFDMEATIMNAIDVQTHAHKLYAAHGPKALAEAHGKVVQFEKTGAKTEAQDWKQIEAALRNLKPPHAS
jgi:hypothetical protein